MNAAKVSLLSVIAVALGGSACAPMLAQARPAQAHSEVELQAALDPFGSWMVVPELGRVWRPRGMGVGWTPYTQGRWVYVDDEWTWESHFAWGWAAFHYGRWYQMVQHGWVWVPGRVWAPAWVVWRVGGPYYGWAPRPPRAYAVPRGAWCFVSARDFGRRPVTAARIRGPRLTRNGSTRVSPAPPPRRRGPGRVRPAPAANPAPRARTVPSRRARVHRRAGAAPTRTVKRAGPPPKRTERRVTTKRRVKSAPVKPSQKVRMRTRRLRTRPDR